MINKTILERKKKHKYYFTNRFRDNFNNKMPRSLIGQQGKKNRYAESSIGQSISYANNYEHTKNIPPLSNYTTWLSPHVEIIFY